ncbi:MAG TPA: hypothetical protein VEO54_02685 [Thermoanaerobaculia bacterium]|nr:hypothetical protein [Thermoanaerobaculia bacterium]
MKTTALLFSLLFLLAACKSPTAVMDKRRLGCEPGHDVSLAAAYDTGSHPGELAEKFFMVEVSNNSDHDVTVKSVRVEPSERSRGWRVVQEDTDVTIESGEDHVFRLTATPPLWMRDSAIEAPQGRPSQYLTFFVSVGLSNGDTYQCEFRSEVK